MKSEPSKGSCFTVRIPWNRVQAPAPCAEVKTERPSKLPTGTRILVVEDEFSNQAVAKAILEGAGAQPTIVADGETALKALEAATYDLVLMDVSLPGKNGIEVTQEIRRRYSDGRPLIVALTANAATTVRDTCLAAGMDAFLTKPIYPARLIGTIQEVLQRAQS